MSENESPVPTDESYLECAQNINKIADRLRSHGQLKPTDLMIVNLAGMVGTLCHKLMKDELKDELELSIPDMIEALVWIAEVYDRGYDENAAAEMAEWALGRREKPKV